MCSVHSFTRHLGAFKLAPAYALFSRATFDFSFSVIVIEIRLFLGLAGESLMELWLEMLTSDETAAISYC